VKKIWIGIVCCAGYLHAQSPRFPAEVLEQPEASRSFFESVWEVSEVNIFRKDPSVRSFMIANGYASSMLQPARGWPPRLAGYRVLEVNMILTKYPRNKNFWRTNYYSLMAERLQALFRMDPRLNDTTISYGLIFQTACHTEKEAQSLFHGFEIVYEEIKEQPQNEISVFDTLHARNEDSLYWINANRKVERQIRRGGGIGDSVVVKALRTLELDSALIVVDCTGSMDPYTNQVLLWLTRRFNDRSRYFALFTDAGESRKIGSSGGILTGAFEKVDGLMKLFRKARSYRGKNREPEENDIEAILTGLREFPFATSVVLIADNNSCVRDISLLSCIPVPVHVIACGMEFGLNPQYLDIAVSTRGSLYMGVEKWEDFGGGEKIKQFTAGPNTYHFDRGKKHFVHDKKNLRVHASCDRFYSRKQECP